MLCVSVHIPTSSSCTTTSKREIRAERPHNNRALRSLQPMVPILYAKPSLQPDSRLNRSGSGHGPWRWERRASSSPPAEELIDSVTGDLRQCRCLPNRPMTRIPAWFPGESRRKTCSPLCKPPTVSPSCCGPTVASRASCRARMGAKAAAFPSPPPARGAARPKPVRTFTTEIPNAVT